MNRLGKKVFEHDFGDAVYAVVLSDKSSKKLSVNIYVLYKDGTMSEIITIPRKDIYTKKNCFDFFLDMEGDFGRDDIDKIKMGVIGVLKEDNCRESVQARATIEELHQSISDYIRQAAKPLSDKGENEIFIRDNYGFMKTESLKIYEINYKGLGYKHFEILRNLKIMGALQPANNRSYDTLVSINGKKKRYYKIELAEPREEETADEVIEFEIEKKEEEIENGNQTL